MDEGYTVAYLCYPDADNVVAMGETVAEVAAEAAAAGLRLHLYEAHEKAGSWYIECHDYNGDGEPIGENAVRYEDVRQAFA